MVCLYFTAVYKDTLSNRTGGRPISSKDNHLRYPELAGSPLEHVEPPTHFELSYRHNTHYNSIVSLTGELRNDLPELNHEEVHVAEVL